MLGRAALLACLFEVTSRKVGNVHRFRDFENLTYLDFVLSASAIAPVIEDAPRRSVGESILLAIEATRRVVQTNTNLGIVLLLVPLAKSTSRANLSELLRSLTVLDSKQTYRAIRLAQPGAMGKVKDQDLEDEPTLPLLELMRMAENRDRIAFMYTNGFTPLFEFGVPKLLEGWDRFRSLEAAIVFCQLNWLAEHGDSLISRKRVDAENCQAQNWAREFLTLGLETSTGRERLTQFDRWLRDSGHARNPGTTADLVTASLFVALQERKISGLEPFPWPAWTG